MDKERNRLVNSFVIPALFILVIWLIKVVEVVSGVSFAEYGLEPLKPRGLIGIVTAPFLHADWSHLFANSVPLFILGGMLFYFYTDDAVKIVLLIWFITGLWVWVFARGDGVHIGASGVAYGLASFLFFSGIIRRDTTQMAVTLLVTFLYGGMVWGVFPQFFPKQNISWESHLMGILAGVVLSWFFRDSGPQRKVYVWEDEPEDEEDIQGEDHSPDDPNEPPRTL
jgi:membrane associated rhomboid family serine protease